MRDKVTAPAVMAAKGGPKLRMVTAYDTPGATIAIEHGYVFVVQNELKNGADAGALAGARDLYNQDNTVNTGANTTAKDAAQENFVAGRRIRRSGVSASDQLFPVPGLWW